MENKKIEWEKPKLVEIGKSSIITYGRCAGGGDPSVSDFDCTNGGNASNGCSAGSYYFA